MDPETSDRLGALITWLNADAKVCLRAIQWSSMFEDLKSVRSPAPANDVPPPPAGRDWHVSSNEKKADLFRLHLRLGAEWGVIHRVERWVYGLPWMWWHPTVPPRHNPNHSIMIENGDTLCLGDGNCAVRLRERRRDYIPSGAFQSTGTWRPTDVAKWLYHSCDHEAVAQALGELGWRNASKFFAAEVVNRHGWDLPPGLARFVLDNEPSAGLSQRRRRERPH